MGMSSAAWRERRAGREEPRLPWHETLFSDLRLAGRLLSRAPLFTALVVTAIAVGVGGVATVFSALNAIVLRPLPGTTEGTRLILVDRRTPDDSEGVSASNEFYRYVAGSTQSLDGVAAWSRVALTMSTRRTGSIGRGHDRQRQLLRRPRRSAGARTVLPAGRGLDAAGATR